MIKFRMVLGNEIHAYYASMSPQTCVALYNRIYPHGIKEQCIAPESEKSAWCRISGLSAWPVVVKE